MKAGFIGCGAGLLAKSMEDAGIEIEYGIDISELAIKSFEANFPNALSYKKSIEQFSILPEADIVAVTLPCQSMSHANQNRKENPYLLYYALYLIEKNKPKYWFIENVPNAAKYKSGNGNARYYGYTDAETALGRMEFADKGLKLLGNSNERKALVGECVVYEMGFKIGKVLVSLAVNKKEDGLPPTESVGIRPTIL